MQVSSTIERPGDGAEGADAPPTRSLARAIDDIRQGLSHRQLWAHLGWQDIRQRYRRSVIGPLWITISMGVTSVGLGLLYGALLGHPISTYLPYVTTGFIVWGFISGCLTEGMDTFISNEGLIKHLPAPLTVYALRTVWRQTLMFLHNLAIYLVVAGIFITSLIHPYQEEAHGVVQPGIGWASLLAIPGFVLVAINALWLAVLFGIISTRYRDIPQVINSLIQLAFYLTPIIWSPDDLFASGKHSTAKLALDLNPLYHFVQIVRGPLIGQQVSWASWAAVGGITVVGWALALLALRNYRARISYWV